MPKRSEFFQQLRTKRTKKQDTTLQDEEKENAEPSITQGVDKNLRQRTLRADVNKCTNEKDVAEEQYILVAVSTFTSLMKNKVKCVECNDTLPNGTSPDVRRFSGESPEELPYSLSDCVRHTA